MIIRFVCILYIILFIDITYSSTNNKKSSPMSFPRRRQFDETFRRLTRQCEQKESCQKYLSTITLKTDNSLEQQQKELAEIDMINCIRRCISYSCYKDIYENDPLERGEIDVRSNQFKSCWIKEQKE
ncbi:unnamed protein product [Rotaria sordida]|uniref:Uncharacterized protein n=1 Tax=Rotaria sordida TaxID=392033 RepID=A0A814JF04_9BILA|nr:unnamed protein product [Rotaria sordida]CAF1038453.1 unnamed protein product [Rotaria sordida]CAF1156902.1 unnamed protein product [Rotaria sordida]CAF1326234.1 unnamed protein product [Rotaria sordida]CAF1432976.1 unnamed protein product [Rotaria sordida]